MIHYEYPFNERVRTYLRLERLFNRLNELIQRSSAVDHHFALVTLFDLLEMVSRTDLKKDVLCDLERQKQLLLSFKGNPSVDESALAPVIRNAEICYGQLQQLPGKIGSELAQIEWLNTLRSRIGIPGGTCEFDLPVYYAWQNLPENQRQHDLRQWASGTKPMEDSLRLLLDFLRNSGMTQRITTNQGLFQQSLPTNRQYQLLRVSIDPTRRIVPEISGNYLRVSIRLLREDPQRRLMPYPADVSLDITLCA